MDNFLSLEVTYLDFLSSATCSAGTILTFQQLVFFESFEGCSLGTIFISQQLLLFPELRILKKNPFFFSPGFVF
jgi:hypothetical protein